MPRGFVWAEYVSDDGNTYALQVDADYAAVASRGWTSPAPAGTPVYPRGWRPRQVVGVDSSGRFNRAAVGRTTATLWTGAVTTFSVNATDETAHTCTVVKRLPERMSRRP